MGPSRSPPEWRASGAYRKQITPCVPSHHHAAARDPRSRHNGCPGRAGVVSFSGEVCHGTQSKCVRETEEGPAPRQPHGAPEDSPRSAKDRQGSKRLPLQRQDLFLTRSILPPSSISPEDMLTHLRHSSVANNGAVASLAQPLGVCAQGAVAFVRHRQPPPGPAPHSAQTWGHLWNVDHFLLISPYLHEGLPCY